MVEDGNCVFQEHHSTPLTPLNQNHTTNTNLQTVILGLGFTSDKRVIDQTATKTQIKIGDWKLINSGSKGKGSLASTVNIKQELIPSFNGSLRTLASRTKAEN